MAKSPFQPREDGMLSGWIQFLPIRTAILFVMALLIYGQWNPCDSTSVQQGDSLFFILGTFASGFLLSLHGILRGTESLKRAGPLQPMAWNDARLRWLWAIVALFVGWLLIVTASVFGRGNARFAWNGCWQWIAQWTLLIVLTVLQMIPTMRRLMVTLMIGLVAGVAGDAIYQYWIVWPALRERYSDPATVAALVGADQGSSLDLLFKSRLASLEPTGPFALANSLAGFMGPWIVVLISLVITYIARSSKLSMAPWKRWLGWCVAGMVGFACCYVLVLTKSRTAWIATTIGIVGTTCMHPWIRGRLFETLRTFRIYIAGATLFLIAAAIVGYRRDPLVLWEAGKSLTYRFEYWRGGWQLLQQHPWLGFGVGNFQQAYVGVKSVTASESPADPHNFLVEVAVTGGWPLLFLLIAAAIVWLIPYRDSAAHRASANSLSESDSQDASPIVAKYLRVLGLAIAAIVLVGLCILGLTFDEFRFHAAILFFSALAACLVAIRLSEFVQSESLETAAQWGLITGLIHLLASGGWMQPGTMDTLCVLASILIATRCERLHASSNATASASDMSMASRLGLVAVAVGLLAGFYATMGLPLNASAPEFVEGRKEYYVRADPDSIRQAMNKDPWDPILTREIGDAVVNGKLRRSFATTSRASAEELADQIEAEFVHRDPSNWASHFECGRWELTRASLAIPESSERAKHIASAANFFRSATKLFPASAEIQMQAALACYLADDREDSLKFLQTAMEIDQRTPHLDRKLSAAVVFLPEVLRPQELRLEPGARQGVSDDRHIHAEPVATALRNLLIAENRN